MIIPKNKIHVLKAVLSNGLFQPGLEEALSNWKDYEILRQLIDQCTLVEGGDAIGLVIDTVYKDYSK